MIRKLLLVIAIAGISCGSQSIRFNEAPVFEDHAKNVILLIGDGMGLGQISAGMYANGNYISFEKFPVVGLHKCHAADNLVTDSAAGATAFACGKKTYNGAIAVDIKQRPIKTILEEAEDKGLATGLVANCSITHATPASFATHDVYRRNYEQIAADYMDIEVDFMVGGGKKYFDQRTMDDRNLIEELSQKGYQVSSYFDKEIKKVKPDVSKNFMYFTANEEPLPAFQGREYLQQATEKAIKFLDKKSDQGFFLMVEGSQIDWGGHSNNSEYIITEVIEFQWVAEQVLKWAKKDKETLVIVTADHETGGYAIQEGSSMDSLSCAFTSTYHTATMIPVFAFGPGADQFSGIYENTEIYHKMRKAYGW